MPNQYVNEVIYNGQTLIGLQNDTVTPDKVLAGETFHDRSGAPQTGSLIAAKYLVITETGTGAVYDILDTLNIYESAPIYLSANVYGALVNKSQAIFSGVVSRQDNDIFRFDGCSGIENNYKPVSFYKEDMSSSSYGTTQFIDVVGENNNIQNAIAIVSNGNIHPAITKGEFVYIKNHSNLSDGLYVADADIIVDAELTSNNVSQDPEGGLNTLNNKISKRITKTITPGGSITIGSDELPKSYIIATNGNHTGSLTLGFGSGYGAGSTRHKIQVVQTGSNITYTVSNSEYGLTISNSGTGNVAVYVSEI